ncbi:MAG TPA: hypothetical protein VI056_13685 [Candidatus Limnocylindria bacterium]
MALLYLAAHGARAPFLALLGLRRLRNLALVLAPYAVTVPLAFAVSERLDPAAAAGLVAVVLAPGAFLAPVVVIAAGGRRADMAGALLLGTAVISFVLVATRPGAVTLALTAAQAFALASLVAGALPTVRDRLLVPLRWAGHAAGIAVIVLAAAGGPRIDATTVAVALAAVALLLSVAGAAAAFMRRDVFSALAATGTRDPIVATALAWSTGGVDATAVPLASAVILGIAAAALVIRRR